MIFSRKTILVVGAALLAACGDKVSVQEYTPPPVSAKVNSVEVAPATASMLVGETATFTAAVNADAGVATTVTWTSSDAAKASVSSAGVVTAVAASPGVAICATSTVDTGKKGCATVAVRVAQATGLTVAPQSATLNIGNTLQLTAAVLGATATPTWTTSNAAAVTVSTTGLVTAVAATPGVAVCAAAAGYTACSTIIVSGVVVTGVQVVPSSATLNYSQTVQLTASITGSNTTNTFSWAAGDALVTVSTSGLVTAGTTAGTSSVCATSTQDTSKRACAAITIVAPPAVVPATVSINSITATGNTATTVNPSAVAGNIDVTLNYTSGTQTVQKIELMLGDKIVASQTLTPAQAAALRFASEIASAADNTVPQVVFTVNTAACGATPATCAVGNITPSWLNVATALQARIYTKEGGAAAASASASQNLTFANVDGFILNTTTTGRTAVDGAGYRWTGNGSLTFIAYPVMYSGASVGTVNVAFGPNQSANVANLCVAPGANLGAGAATVAGTDGGYSVTLALAGLSSIAACQTTYPQQAAITALSSAGENLTLVANGVLNTQVGFRWDNAAPAAPALVANPNGRANGWINDAVVFNTVQAAANLNGWIAAATADVGISAVAGSTAVSYAVKASTTRTLAIAATAIANATTLDRSATNATYCALAYAVDALGNTSANPAACNLNFGVDRDAPTVTYVAAGATTLEANDVYNATLVAAGRDFRVTVVDGGLIGNSGMLPGSPVLGTITFRGNGNTAAQACFLGGASCAPVALAAAAPVYSTAAMNAGAAGNTVATEGYYTFNATGYDAAGNATSVAPRTVLVDATLPIPGAAATALTVASGFTTNGFINENLDIRSWWLAGNYAGAPAPLAPAVIGQAATSVNGFNAATFQNTNYAVSGAFNLPLEIQANLAAGLTAFSGVQIGAMNQGYSIAYGAASVPGFTAPAAIGLQAPNWLTFGTPAFAAGITGVSSGFKTAATAARPASITLSVTTTGTTAVFNNPFSRVDLYALDITGAEWRLIGTTTASTLTDDGVTRTFTYPVTINGASVYTTLGGNLANGATMAGQNVIAIGFNAAGTVGMVGAGALALPIVW